jgi:hypothetical protein
MPTTLEKPVRTKRPTHPPRPSWAEGDPIPCGDSRHRWLLWPFTARYACGCPVERHAVDTEAYERELEREAKVCCYRHVHAPCSHGRGTMCAFLRRAAERDRRDWGEG